MTPRRIPCSLIYHRYIKEISRIGLTLLHGRAIIVVAKPLARTGVRSGRALTPPDPTRLGAVSVATRLFHIGVVHRVHAGLAVGLDPTAHRRVPLDLDHLLAVLVALFAVTHLGLLSSWCDYIISHGYTTYNLFGKIFLFFSRARDRPSFGSGWFCQPDPTD